MIVGIVMGLVVVMQIMLVKVNSRDQPGAVDGRSESATSTAQFGDESEPWVREAATSAASSSSPSTPPADFPKALPAGAMETDVSEID